MFCVLYSIFLTFTFVSFFLSFSFFDGRMQVLTFRFLERNGCKKRHTQYEFSVFAGRDVGRVCTGPIRKGRLLGGRASVRIPHVTRMFVDIFLLFVSGDDMRD